MLCYFIAAVRTSAIKYSTITVQRKYVGGDMLICCGNRQFGLRNRRNVYMCTFAWQFAPRGKLKNVWRFWWQLSPAELDFLLCAIREQKITGSGRWRGPIPPPARVTYTGHACRQGDVIGCNNFSSWMYLCMHSNMLMSLKYFTTAFILFYCSVIAATSAHLQ